jgi:hypothetical protein
MYFFKKVAIFPFSVPLKYVKALKITNNKKMYISANLKKKPARTEIFGS